MSLLDAIVLGLVQGLTEFIPVSSSGHLFIVDSLLNLQGNFQLETALNIGTLFAAILYFNNDIKAIIRELIFGKSKLATLLIITTGPGVLAGLIIGTVTESGIRSGLVTVCALFVVGITMLFEPKLEQSKSSITKINRKEAFIIGLSQIAALVPGTSRSAATIITGRALGFDRTLAARYSFIASIPIIFAAVVYVLVFDYEQLAGIAMSVIIVGIITSFISALAAIHFMITLLKKIGLRPFGWYRIAIAPVLLLLL